MREWKRIVEFFPWQEEASPIREDIVEYLSRGDDGQIRRSVGKISETS